MRSQLFVVLVLGVFLPRLLLLSSSAVDASYIASSSSSDIVMGEDPPHPPYDPAEAAIAADWAGICNYYRFFNTPLLLTDYCIFPPLPPFSSLDIANCLQDLILAWNCTVCQNSFPRAEALTTMHDSLSSPSSFLLLLLLHHHNHFPFPSLP